MLMRSREEMDDRGREDLFHNLRNFRCFVDLCWKLCDVGEHDGPSTGSVPLLEVPSPLSASVMFERLSPLIKWSASIVVVSEVLRRPFRTEVEPGGLDFERRL